MHCWLGPISTEGTADPCALSLWHLLQSMRPMCHSSGGTVATHKPLLCSRVRKVITYPGLELNQRHNCFKRTDAGCGATGALCSLAAMYSHIPSPCSSTAATLPQAHLCQMCCLTAFSFETPCACALTSGAVTGRLLACASCLGPTSLTFAVFT